MVQGSSGGDGHGGEAAAKRPNLSSSAVAGRDHLSALPDDIIALILLRLDTIAESVRTSILSTRWRRVWTLLPELTFSGPYNRRILQVLSAPDPDEAPALRRIAVVTDDTDPVDSVAAWLPIAARRLSGTFMYHNTAAEGEQEEDEEEEEEEEEEEKGAIALPCFRNATKIDLNLRFFGLALPSSGAFTGLAELILERVRFQGACEVGDMVSSPRCPFLKRLRIQKAYGVARLTIHSESLLEMDLGDLNNGLQRLDIDAPVLEELVVSDCFGRNQPVANISAPQLIHLMWRDAYDSSHVQLGLKHLQELWTGPIPVYGPQPHHNGYNLNVLPLVQHFQVIHSLCIVLGYPPDLGNLQYLMEGVTYLPHVTILTICVINSGHAFGASLFHVLRLCTGVRRLLLILHTSNNLEPQSTCPSGCICHQPTTWKTEKLSLSCLKEIDIFDVKGAKHEVAFLKRLFNWAGVLEKLRITFNYSVSKSKAEELCQRLSQISRAETLVEFYMYRDSGNSSVDLLSLEDEGAWV